MIQTPAIVYAVPGVRTTLRPARPVVELDSIVLLGTRIANVAFIAPSGDVTLILAEGTLTNAPLRDLTLLAQSPVYRDGVRAFQNGTTLDLCPHGDDTWEQAVWIAGWEQNYPWKETTD